MKWIHLPYQDGAVEAIYCRTVYCVGGIAAVLFVCGTMVDIVIGMALGTASSTGPEGIPNCVVGAGG